MNHLKVLGCLFSVAVLVVGCGSGGIGDTSEGQPGQDLAPVLDQQVDSEVEGNGDMNGADNQIASVESNEVPVLDATPDNPFETNVEDPLTPSVLEPSAAPMPSNDEEVEEVEVVTECVGSGIRSALDNHANDCSPYSCRSSFNNFRLRANSIFLDQTESACPVTEINIMAIRDSSNDVIFGVKHLSDPARANVGYEFPIVNESNYSLIVQSIDSCGCLSNEIIIESP